MSYSNYDHTAKETNGNHQVTDYPEWPSNNQRMKIHFTRPHSPYGANTVPIPIFKYNRAPKETVMQTQQWFDEHQEAVPQSQDLKSGGKFGSNEKQGKAEFSAAISPTTPEATNISSYADRKILNTHMPSILYHEFQDLKHSDKPENVKNPWTKQFKLVSQQTSGDF